MANIKSDMLTFSVIVNDSLEDLVQVQANKMPVFIHVSATFKKDGSVYPGSIQMWMDISDSYATISFADNSDEGSPQPNLQFKKIDFIYETFRFDCEFGNSVINATAKIILKGLVKTIKSVIVPRLTSYFNSELSKQVWDLLKENYPKLVPIPVPNVSVSMKMSKKPQILSDGVIVELDGLFVQTDPEKERLRIEKEQREFEETQKRKVDYFKSIERPNSNKDA